MRQRLELSITNRCNLRCADCFRLMGRVPQGDGEDMSVEQVLIFIEQVRAGGRIGKTKLTGGEPMLHPDIVEIFNLLAVEAEARRIGQLQVNTNGTVPIPEGLNRSPRATLHAKKQTRKTHHPAFSVPADFGMEPICPCSIPYSCGAALDAYGYLPCAPAIPIVRAFHLEHLYRDSLPGGFWGGDELGPLCCFAMPEDWKAKTPRCNGPMGTYAEPLGTWAAVLDSFGPVRRERWKG